MSTGSQYYSTSAKSEHGCKEQLEFTGHQQLSSVHVAVSAQQPPPLSPESLVNGFLSGDLLKDFLKPNKINNLPHYTTAAKHEKIRLMIEESISKESRSHVQEIFSQVEHLKIEEKLLLYLKLPTSLVNVSGTDPLRQPLNPLGNRYEIHQTIMWIKTHLEEDQEVSLPKQEVYDEYNIFCSKNSMKPLSTADFGKVMKQVYPCVRPRRLGTRGNSRYCYSGMRKRQKLNPPTLPLVSESEMGDDTEYFTEEMLGAASTLIREWAETLLDAKFPTLYALGKYLVNNLCVDSQSLAAICILNGSEKSEVIASEASSELLITPESLKIANLRKTQRQLQRKLQQRESIRQQKHQDFSCVLQNQAKEKIDNQSNDGVGGVSKRVKKGKANVKYSLQDASSLNKLHTVDVINNAQQKKVFKNNNQSCSISLQSNCDNLVIQSPEDELNYKDSIVMSKTFTRKRANVNIVTQATKSSPEKQLKLVNTQNEQLSLDGINDSANSRSKLSSPAKQQSTKISVILANNSQATKSNKATHESTVSAFVIQPKKCDKQSLLNSNDYSKLNRLHNEPQLISESNRLNRDKTLPFQEHSKLKIKDKFSSTDSDALSDYLNGGNNSQEQEEELLQYFQQSNSSSSDMELNGCVSDLEQISRQDKVSQLRIILQENLKDVIVPTSKARPQNLISNKQQIFQKHNLILPTILNHNNVLNARRRVSFGTSAVKNSQDNTNNTNILMNNTVPQSPNTRRRIFNFTPISPGPHSPINARASNSNSANVSPFVSPRNTPVPRSRSNLQGSCRSRNSHRTLSRSTSCNASCSTIKNDTFIVPTSGSDIVSYVCSPLNSVNSKTTCSSQVVSLKGQNSTYPPFLSDLTVQDPQLLINYPSQENLQEIKNISQKQQPADKEISDLLQKEGTKFTKEQLNFRSQSVPLHRMVNPVLLSPLSHQQIMPTFVSHSSNPSTNSSVAATPVPSEFNDFVSIGTSDNSNYLIDVDPLGRSNESFLIENKEIISENLNKIFDILNEEKDSLTKDIDTDKSSINLNIITAEPYDNITLSNQLVLDDSTELEVNWAKGTDFNNANVINSQLNICSKTVQSRSYPNTPLPLPNSSFKIQYPECSNGTRSYPTTPSHNLQYQDNYTRSNEPMLFNPSSNTHNLHSEISNIGSVCLTSVPCDVADFVKNDIPREETDDLESLTNFEGLHDVSVLSPLFTEVVESNH